MNQSFLETYINYILSRVDYVLLKFVTSVFVSLVGIVLFSLFLTTFLRLGAVVKVLPVVIAFFSCMAAYYFIDKTRDRAKRKGLLSILAGVTTSMVAFWVLNFIFRELVDAWVLGIFDFVVFVAVGAFFSEIGASVAIRYFKLQRR